MGSPKNACFLKKNEIFIFFQFSGGVGGPPGGVGGPPGGSRGAQGAQKTPKHIFLTVSPPNLFKQLLDIMLLFTQAEVLEHQGGPGL